MRRSCTCNRIECTITVIVTLFLVCWGPQTKDEPYVGRYVILYIWHSRPKHHYSYSVSLGNPKAREDVWVEYSAPLIAVTRREDHVQQRGLTRRNGATSASLDWGPWFVHRTTPIPDRNAKQSLEVPKFPQVHVWQCTRTLGCFNPSPKREMRLAERAA